MKKFLSNPYLSLALRLVVGFVMVFAAVGKIADPDTFAREISNYGIMPDFTINIFAITLAWIELAVGVFLVVGIRLKASAAITGILMAVFIAAILSAMVRGLNINCGCFSHRIVYVGWPKVIEDLGLLVASVVIFFFPVNKFTIEHLAVKEHNDNNIQEV